MALTIEGPEVFGVSESSLTGEPRAVSAGTAGTRLVRIEGLAPATDYRIDIEVASGEPRVGDAS
jgi:hypothetical protein